MGLVSELKRRNVLRMAALYIVTAWLVMQVVDVLGGLIPVPSWVGPAVIGTLAVGFPVALLLSWFYELTPQGISRDKNVLPGRSIAHATGRRIDFLAIALLSAALVVFAYDKWWPTRTAASPVSIAVLPFLDLSTDGQQETFSSGMTDELIVRLTQVDGLQVTPRTSVNYFRNRNEDLKSIAQQLSVGHVLEGSVRRAGTELKVTATLTDAGSGFQLWSQTYERAVEGIFGIQAEIAESVAAALSIELGVGEFDNVEGGTRNIDAYESFRAGFAAEDSDDLLGAVRNFERATELDPNFALAWAELAVCYNLAFSLFGESETVPFLKWRDEAIEQAVRLAPGSRQIIEISAQMEIHRNRLQRARAILDEIHRSDAPAAPRYSLPYIDLLTKTGNVGDALWVAGRVSDRDPLNPRLPQYFAHLNLSLSRFDNALQDIARGYDLGHLQGFYAVEAVYIALARNDPGEIRKWLVATVGDSPQSPSNIFKSMLERLGDADNSLDWLRGAYDRGAGYDYHVINWASYYGDTELALKAMRRSPDLWVFWTPLTAELRTTPEFKEIVTDLGLVDYWREYGWNDFCRPVGDDDFECR